jgi:hypothetical protein
MDELEYIQKELYKARYHLRAARDEAWKAGWSNDEGYAISILARCADAVDESLQSRYVEGARDYDVRYEVEYLLDIDEPNEDLE